MSNVLEVDTVSKWFRSFCAVDAVSFHVAAGETVAVIGPNGAGKSTTLNMVTGLVTPDAGSIHINGINLVRQRTEALACLNIGSSYATLPGSLSVRESLEIYARLYSVPNPGRVVGEVIERFDLTSLRGDLLRNLSTGQRVRVNLAKSMLNSPALLVLDEAMANLDPVVARAIHEDLRKWSTANGRAIVLTSHNLQEIETYCDRIYLMVEGKISATGTAQELNSTANSESLEETFVLASVDGSTGPSGEEDNES